MHFLFRQGRRAAAAAAVSSPPPPLCWTNKRKWRKRGRKGRRGVAADLPSTLVPAVLFACLPLGPRGG